MESEIIHIFDADISGIELPRRLNSPFNYVPHPLSEIAADEVRRFVATVPELDAELSRGKMLGVLVVKCGDGRLGFIAAYSGSLEQHSLASRYFVPPIFDLLDAEGYFKQQESEISGINHRIADMENCAELATARATLDAATKMADEEIEHYKNEMARCKAERDKARVAGNADEKALIKESQYQKAELRRLRKSWNEKLNEAKLPLQKLLSEINELKAMRHRRSEALQQWIFSQFVMLNACGERRNLLGIFSVTPQRVPPAGAGECAAPRLFQYAYVHGLRPLSIAEFWYGKSDGSVVRHAGHFYPACRGKCLPILTFMLKGLDVDVDSPYEYVNTGDIINVLYEDEWIVAVDKPAGMPTVPGRNCGRSLLDFLSERYTALGGPLVVHRLDMDTSGIVLFAKDKETHKRLQAMFARREISKRYVALIDGLVSNDKGVIELPLRPDYVLRPMQVVDEENGNVSITRYEVINRCKVSKTTLVYFYPLTGRTHQLRVHSAHRHGLGMPIVGDKLYGTAGSRLFLHAESLVFIHPWNGRKIELRVRVPSCFTEAQQAADNMPQ